MAGRRLRPGLLVAVLGLPARDWTVVVRSGALSGPGSTPRKRHHPVGQPLLLALRCHAAHVARAVALLLALTLCGCGGVAASDDGSRAADLLGSGADQCSLPVEERQDGWFCSGTQPQAGQPASGSPTRTVLFNVEYIGIDRERQNDRHGLQRCLEQPGTTVTVSDAGSPPIRQVSVTGGRDATRRFEQCLLMVLNATIERVPQQVDASNAEQHGRSLAERYDEAPAWPGDSWTKNGGEVSREELVLAAGPEHCAWQDSAAIGGKALSAPRDEVGPHWVRDPKGVLVFDPRAKAEFRSPAQLPSDAAWTGYAQDGVELWVAPSDSADYVYLLNSADRSDTERWVRGGGCG